MKSEKVYEKALVELGTVLLLVKNMQNDLIGRIEALPLHDGERSFLDELKAGTERITKDDICHRIHALYPDAEIIPAERIDSLLESNNDLLDMAEELLEENESLQKDLDEIYTAGEPEMEEKEYVR